MFDLPNGFQPDVQNVDYGNAADFPKICRMSGIIKGLPAQDYRSAGNCHSKLTSIVEGFLRKGRYHGKPFQAAAPEDNSVSCAEPGMGIQVAVFLFGHAKVECAGDLPSSKHHFAGNGLGQALGFPWQMVVHGQYGAGDGYNGLAAPIFIIFVNTGHVDP